MLFPKSAQLSILRLFFQSSVRGCVTSYASVCACCSDSVMMFSVSSDPCFISFLFFQPEDKTNLASSKVLSICIFLASPDRLSNLVRGGRQVSLRVV